MGPFPSKLDFVSLLQYSPRGTTAVSKQSRDVTYAVKQDGFIGQRRVIDQVAQVVEQEIANHSFLTDCFGDDVTLIPVPRSSPQKSGALWPPLLICQALLARGLARDVLPCLKRVQPVRKSATSTQRPDPPDHFDSIGFTMQPSLTSPLRITLVDDVITRGSSLMGIYPHLENAFPGIAIRCFAVVRTESSDEVAAIRDPCSGVITYQGGQCFRRP